ncbi:MAG: hypothetical protein WC007_06655 [Pelobacteraceae bacterium]
MKLLARSHIAIILTVIYSLIVMGPLAGRLMNSKTVTHALTGECTGDCATCGCSAESMATRTCCCSIKKQRQALLFEDEHDGTRDCCKKTPAKKQVVIASCGCPCGSGNHAVSISETSELLPCFFATQFSIPHTDTRFQQFARFLASRHGEPPDPPPKLSIG